MKGKGGEEDFRAFPQFQICHYTTTYSVATLFLLLPSKDSPRKQYIFGSVNVVC